MSFYATEKEIRARLNLPPTSYEAALKRAQASGTLSKLGLSALKRMSASSDSGRKTKAS